MNGRGGCGCGTVMVAFLAIGVLELAAGWIGRHPLPAAAITVVAVVGLTMAARVWRDGQRRRPVVLTPPPAGWCSTCGERIAVGQAFCVRCGARVG